MYYKAASGYGGYHHYYWVHFSTIFNDGRNSGGPWSGATWVGGDVNSDCTCIANGQSCVYSYDGWSHDRLCTTGATCGANHGGAPICCSGGTCCNSDTNCPVGWACELDYTPSTAVASPAYITCPSTNYPALGQSCVQQANIYSCEPVSYTHLTLPTILRV